MTPAREDTMRGTDQGLLDMLRFDLGTEVRLRDSDGEQKRETGIRRSRGGRMFLQPRIMD